MIENYYTADGMRWQSIIYTVKPSVATLSGMSGVASSFNMVTRFYRGNREYANDWNTLVRLHNPLGYITLSSDNKTITGWYHYAKDYLGNVREVYRVNPNDSKAQCLIKYNSIMGGKRPSATMLQQRCCTLVQRMNYYPSGLPLDNCINPDEQPYKYTGKEYVEEHGLDEYDNGARWYYPALARTSTMDPKCESYYDVSPYSWCNNNFVNLVDKSGMDWASSGGSSGGGGSSGEGSGSSSSSSGSSIGSTSVDASGADVSVGDGEGKVKTSSGEKGEDSGGGASGGAGRSSYQYDANDIRWTDAKSKEEFEARGEDGVYLGKAVLVMNGSRDEKLGIKRPGMQGYDPSKGEFGYIDGECADVADVTFYAPDGTKKMGKGLTMSSDYSIFGAIESGDYDVIYMTSGKGEPLPSHWLVVNRGVTAEMVIANAKMGWVSELDGKLNDSPFAVATKNTPYKDAVYVHSTNQSGWAGAKYDGAWHAVSAGCPVLAPETFKAVNSNMITSGYKLFVLRITR